MNQRRATVGLNAIFSLLRNHVLIQPSELKRVEALASEVAGIADDEFESRTRLSSIYDHLRELEAAVIRRELGSPLFDGVPLSMLEHAVELARASVPEDEGARPHVGAVILRGNELISAASRNQDGLGGHAEQIAIESCSDARLLKGSTVITTLEPCTRRGSLGRRPCFELLVVAGVKRVIFGHMDPNIGIRGYGEQALRKNGVEVGYFPSGLAEQLWNLNSRFISIHTKDSFRAVFLPAD